MKAMEISTELSEKPRLGKILTEKVPDWKKASANDCYVGGNFEISVRRASGDRFTAKDPIRFKGGYNFYAYTLGNPINFIDPLGLWTVGIGFNVGGGAGYGGTYGYNIVADSNGLHTQSIGGGGSYIGASGGFTITAEASTASNVHQLEGAGFQAGGSAGEVFYGEGGVFGGPSDGGYGGVYGGIGLGGGLTPGAGFMFGTYTYNTTTLFEWSSLWDWTSSLWDFFSDESKPCP